MNLLTRMDLALGSMMDNVFRLGRGFQPADIARLLRHSALAKERNTLTASYAPNNYIVGLAAEDHRRLEPIQSEIVEDLTRAMAAFLEQQGLMTLGDLRVSMEPQHQLSRGRVKLKAIFRPDESA